MSKNENLLKAKRDKRDEFYTQLGDIENELKHYKQHFKDKVIFCNCDDPYESNFFKYFALNFNALGIKKLIATSYSGSPITGKQLSLFEDEENKTAYKYEINEIKDFNADGAIDLVDIEYLLKNEKNTITKLEQGRDFRSEESIFLLKQADIIVTNPPFSLFREYINLLHEYKKFHITLGSQNAITYKEIFSLIRDRKVWLGKDNYGNKWFQVPFDYEIKTKNREKIVDEVKYMSKGDIVWFTNLDISKRHEELILYKKYTPEEYPEYDNYNAIEVSKVAEIPYDYDGVMGVPVTFLDKHNPEQFEILGTSDRGGDGQIDYLKREHIRFDAPVVKGQGKYKRIFIKRTEQVCKTSAF